MQIETQIQPAFGKLPGSGECRKGFLPFVPCGASNKRTESINSKSTMLSHGQSGSDRMLHLLEPQAEGTVVGEHHQKSEECFLENHRNEWQHVGTCGNCMVLRHLRTSPQREQTANQCSLPIWPLALFPHGSRQENAVTLRRKSRTLGHSGHSFQKA